MFKDVPNELKQLKQWVCYRKVDRNGKVTKVPTSPYTGRNINSNDEMEWLSFETANSFIGATSAIDGVGFVFSNNDDYIGIDIDNCFINGEFNEVAKDILSIFEGLAYAEFSPSGKGIHLIIRGTKENSKSKNSELGLEIYDSKRYFTVTGNKIAGYDKIQICSNEINNVCNKFLEGKEEKRANMILNEVQENYLSDEKILDLMFKNKGGERLQRLYLGDWEGYYTSKSEADLAFCNALAFYSNKDFAQMDSIFRMSKLFNHKWDEIHYKEGYTYGDGVIQKSIEGTNFTYNPKSFGASHSKAEVSRAKSIEEKKSKIPHWYRESGHSIVFMSGVLAKYLSENKKYFYAYERFYLYENGVYEEVPFAKMKREIQGYLLEEHSKSHQIIDTLEQLKNKVDYEADILNFDFSDRKINFKNGLYDIEQEALSVHTPNIKSVIQINANYRVDVECPNFIEFMKKSLETDDILIAQELLGYLMIANTSAEKAFILYGPGRTGKSTFLKLIELLVGKKHISNVPLQSLSDKFKTSLLFGKLVNIYADLPNKPLEDTGIFKTLVSGDTIVAEEKFQTPFSFSNVARLVFSCNELPANYVDRTDGFYRRLIILPFLKQVKEEDIDTTLVNKFERELDGITQWALIGLKRLIANNYQFTKSETTQKVLAEYRKQSNNVIWFVEDFCDLNPSSSVYSGEIYQYYKSVCLANNMQAISQTKFNKAIEAEYKNKVIRTFDNNKRVIYKGLQRK